jgi:transposase
VEFVAQERKTESLAAYYQQLTDVQKTALQAVAMDMWEPYIGATCDGLPARDTKIVFDRFHIMRDTTQAVDTVRRQEHRAFSDNSPLTGTKYLCCSAMNAGCPWIVHGGSKKWRARQDSNLRPPA